MGAGMEGSDSPNYVTVADERAILRKTWWPIKKAKNIEDDITVYFISIGLLRKYRQN